MYDDAEDYNMNVEQILNLELFKHGVKFYCGKIDFLYILFEKEPDASDWQKLENDVCTYYGIDSIKSGSGFTKMNQKELNEVKYYFPSNDLI